MNRIDKIVSNRGVGSRKDVQKLFQQGKVSFNGKIVRSGSIKVPSDAEIIVDGELTIESPLIAIYNKPVGVQSTIGDPWGRESLSEAVKNLNPHLKKLHPVGRLDADTSGLLLFSRDGILTSLLLHPNSNIPRVYEAIVDGEVIFANLQSILSQGVATSDGTFPAELLSSQVLDKATDGKPSSKITLSVTEGKYRMVRRILHNAGHSVTHLHRISYGNIRLDDLPSGDVRLPSPEELNWCSKLLLDNSRKIKKDQG